MKGETHGVESATASGLPRHQDFDRMSRFVDPLPGFTPVFGLSLAVQ